ncbi:MAG: SDR family oxidoreductase [Alphaproteobacteria bacterium]|nr:SDR family oxidoreductase [Alphaproteobacteria bacterium]
MDFGLKGKTALITGASGGIGFASAKALLSEGANVIIVSRDKTRGEQAVEELSRNTSNHVSYVQGDISSPDNIIDALGEKTIDIFVGSSGGPSMGQAQNLSSADLETALNSNLIGLVSLTNALMPNMQKKKWGRIVYITTSGVIIPISKLALSNIARSALTAYAKTLAGDVAHHGVTVNTVMPGKIDTERLQFLQKKKADHDAISLEQFREREAEEIPAKRFGEPEEIASMVAFLCSVQASYVTGNNIAVDGGFINVNR